MQQYSISIVIPAFNESAVIGATISEIQEYCRSHQLDYEIIVVDDGSTDDTVALVKAMSGVTLISNEKNSGKGFTVKRGLLAATKGLLLFMDADNSTSITELDHMVPELNNADMVIGSRALAQSRVELSQHKLKRMMGRLGNRVIQVLLGLPFRDTQCGFKLMKRDVRRAVERLTIDRWGFDFELLYIANKYKFRIHESPVRWVNNFDSKVTAWSYVHVVGELMSVRNNDLRGRYN